MNLYESFYLSDRDDELCGGSSVRDVLGHMVLWSELGHRVVPNLTEQTGTFRGFQVLLSGLRAHEVYCDKCECVPIEPFFQIWEQLCAFSVAYVNGDDQYKYSPLPGVRALGRLKGQYRLSPKTRLLQNQLGGGVWGLYRGAAEAAGLVTYRHSASGRYRQCILGNGVKLREEAVYSSQTFLEAMSQGMHGEDGFWISGRRSGGKYWDLFAEIDQLVRRIPDRRLQLEHLLPDGEVSRDMARCILVAQPDASRRTLLELFKQKVPKHAHAFNDIADCEEYLGTINVLFEALCAYSGRSVDALACELCELKPGEMEKARGCFEAIQFQSGQAQKNQALYAARVDCTSVEAILRSIVDCHHEISSSPNRKFEPWIDVTRSGKIQGNRDMLNSERDPRTVRVGEMWVNDYYLTPLQGIALEARRYL